MRHKTSHGSSRRTSQKLSTAPFDSQFNSRSAGLLEHESTRFPQGGTRPAMALATRRPRNFRRHLSIAHSILYSSCSPNHDSTRCFQWSTNPGIALSAGRHRSSQRHRSIANSTLLFQPSTKWSKGQKLKQNSIIFSEKLEIPSTFNNFNAQIFFKDHLLRQFWPKSTIFPEYLKNFLKTQEK